MAPARLARITRKRPVLDRLVWYHDPTPINIHLHSGRGHTVRRGSTVAVVAAARAFGIAQRRVDVMGIARELKWKAGGMPPAMFGPSAKPLSGRYLSFAEREEIALLRAQGCTMQEWPAP